VNENQDEHGRVMADRTKWETAQNFSDLCSLGAEFLEGKLMFFPGYYGPAVEEETVAIGPYLAALNRAGFLTTDSQPGLDNGYSSKQRAFVEGLVKNPIFARLIERLALTSDLYVLVSHRGQAAGLRIPVTIDDFKAFTFAGDSWEDMNGEAFGIEGFSEVCSEAALRELKETFYVCIIDLCWGRRDYLWQTLARDFLVGSE
jgi:hypothetical protein